MNTSQVHAVHNLLNTLTAALADQTLADQLLAELDQALADDETKYEATARAFLIAMRTFIIAVRDAR